jgi:hypothetical protein
MGKHHKPLTEEELRQMVDEEFATPTQAERAQNLGKALQDAREIRESIQDSES